MKPTHVKWSTYNNFDVENDGNDPKFKVGAHIRISKYKSSKNFFVIKKVKNRGHVQ